MADWLDTVTASIDMSCVVFLASKIESFRYLKGLPQQPSQREGTGNQRSCSREEEAVVKKKINKQRGGRKRERERDDETTAVKWHARSLCVRNV